MPICAQSDVIAHAMTCLYVYNQMLNDPQVVFSFGNSVCFIIEYWCEQQFDSFIFDHVDIVVSLSINRFE